MPSPASVGHRGRNASFSSITESFPLLRTQSEDIDVTNDSSNEKAKKNERLWNLMSSYLPSDPPSIQRQIANHVEYTLASSRFSFDNFKAYIATAMSIRDRLIEAWNDTNHHFEVLQVKRVAYLSLEFLMGRSMQNALLNMDLEDNYKEALTGIGFQLEDLYEQERDAALGNGGLGRLAACFLDSMATLDIPAWGYGIRYNYGIFKQIIVDGTQVEVPDYWLTFGNPWEIQRQDVIVEVCFGGTTEFVEDPKTGYKQCVWRPEESVVAMAYDNPIPGFDTFNTINLRLWKSLPAKEFDFSAFNHGYYLEAVEARQVAENISNVLYPADNFPEGKKLRLKQQYFFVAATLHDIVRRFLRQSRSNNSLGSPGNPTSTSNPNVSLGHSQQGRSREECVEDSRDDYTDGNAYTRRGILGYHSNRQIIAVPGSVDWSRFADRAAIQLNDTHPSIAIPELMRILVDLNKVDWDLAWRITKQSFGYTNHTILPEALETWSVELVGALLPRHLEIIREINRRFLKESAQVFGHDMGAIRAISIFDETGSVVRMANLAIVGSHAINGVAALHTDLLKSIVFPEFYRLYPNNFQNKTNGVTPRRWINQANPALAAIISETLNHTRWLSRLEDVSNIAAHATDKNFQHRWREMKFQCKNRLANLIRDRVGVDVNPHALFDVQVKRLHEYKRQKMNALYCIHRYLWIKGLSAEEKEQVQPRVIIFGGKAAPGYWMAKIVIKLIHNIAEVVNNDEDIGDLMKVVFIPNYNVSLAEVIVPASDLSQHISTAGMEASGTSNMKFAMNGGLIIGTLDGANIEIAEEIGNENMFIFGLKADEVVYQRALRRGPPVFNYPQELVEVMNVLAAGKFGTPDIAGPVLDSLDWHKDEYLIAADFSDYLRAQREVDMVYKDQFEWTRRSILSTAGMGKFSTDRTIAEYAKDIWKVSSARRNTPVVDATGTIRRFPSASSLTELIKK